MAQGKADIRQAYRIKIPAVISALNLFGSVEEQPVSVNLAELPSALSKGSCMFVLLSESPLLLLGFTVNDSVK